MYAVITIFHEAVVHGNLYLCSCCLTRRMGRKSSVPPAAAGKLSKALRCSKASEKNTLEIYNALQSDEEDMVATGPFKRLVRQRLCPAMSCFEEEAFAVQDGGEPQIIYLPKLRLLLEFFVRECRAWARALFRALRAQADSAISVLVYSDDIVCGNVLAPRKAKKFCMVYLAPLQLRAHLHHAGTWLLACCAQYAAVERIQGGISAVCGRLVERLLNAETQAGFPLNSPEGSFWVRVQGPLRFVGDHDAIRAVYCGKGSAGLVPCHLCANVAKRNMKATLPEGWTTICEEYPCNFVLRHDADTFARLDAMVDLPRHAREIQEKALGFCCTPESLLLNKHSRQAMPPSLICNEVLHDFFANGVAAWETAYAMQALHGGGISLENLKAEVIACQWRRTGEGWKFAPAVLARLFHSKCWSEETFKGDGNECHSTVFLLNRLLWQKFPEGNGTVRCFQLLTEICRELRSLSFKWEPLVKADLDTLERLQPQHLKAFKLTWGESRVKPKHHHAFHISSAAQGLQMLPHVGIQEKKHQELKASLCDFCEGSLGDYGQMQRTLIPRLLQRSADDMCRLGLSTWGLKDPGKAAPVLMQRQLDDSSLEISDEAILFMRRVAKGDILMCRGTGGRVLAAVSGEKVGLWFCLEKLRLLQKKPWGSLWAHSGTRLWFKPEPNVPFCLAAWWRFTDDNVECLH